MTNLVRVPLAWPIGTRSGSSLVKDPYIRNGMLEKYGEKLYVLKRPGAEDYITLGSGGTDQGITYYNGFFWGVVDDVLYRQAGSLLSSASALSWTQSNVPDWIGTENFGACVFKNRMWLIGGVSTATVAGSGIWSTVDGKKWVVNAGGQPWGFRTHPGVVATDDAMYVVGGFNVTLATCFNDVWKTTDGTNWNNILVAGPGSSTQFGERTNHNVVAANNGLYLLAGQDTTTSTCFNDVWYSADGITWNELTAAAPWVGRTGAFCMFYKNKLYIGGGTDSLGVVLNDVWSSTDGVTWTQETAAAFPGIGRSNAQFCVYRDLMWVIFGSTGLGISSSIFNSSDGATWNLVTSTPGMTARFSGAALVFQTPTVVSQYRYQSMWVFGGDTGAAAAQDVWFADLDLQAPTSFALNPTFVGQPYQFATFLNGQLLLIKNQSNLWVLQGDTLTKVTDPNYPSETVPGIVPLNAFVYVMTPQGEIHSCLLENPLLWPSLQFVTADYENDPAVALAKHLNYVVALGQYTTQFFYDNGANQPVGSALAPYITANLRIGCAVAQSVANVDNALYFIAQTTGGGRNAVRMDGLVPQTVSTPYIDKVLMNASLSYLQGMNYSITGHQFYLVKTDVFTAVVYDTVQNEWYEWDNFGYVDAITNFATGGLYLWTISGGNLLRTDPSLYTDAEFGVFTFTVQTDRIDHGNTAQKFCGRVTLVGDRSTARPSITYSDDDYTNYRNAGTVNMNLSRPYITRLGAFRRRSWKPSQADNYPARWEALEVEFSQGES